MQMYLPYALNLNAINLFVKFVCLFTDLELHQSARRCVCCGRAWPEPLVWLHSGRDSEPRAECLGDVFVFLHLYSFYFSPTSLSEWTEGRSRTCPDPSLLLPWSRLRAGCFFLSRAMLEVSIISLEREVDESGKLRKVSSAKI